MGSKISTARRNDMEKRGSAVELSHPKPRTLHRSRSVDLLTKKRRLERNNRTISTYNCDNDKKNDHDCQTPTIDDTIDQMTTQHYWVRCSWSSNFSAPIIEILGNLDPINRPKVLDVGCGSGTWTLEMAMSFPNVYFI